MLSGASVGLDSLIDITNYGLNANYRKLSGGTCSHHVYTKSATA